MQYVRASIACFCFVVGCAANSGSTTAPGAVDQRIDPIEVGHSWTYDVKVLGNYTTCEAGIHAAPTKGKTSLSGRDAFEVQSLCANAGSFYYAVDGDRVDTYVGGLWVKSLDTPVEDGHTWSNGTANFVWQKVDSIDVPAGTFKDCWRAKQDVAYPSFTIFCRGVGPVVWHYEDGAGNGYDSQLTAKNF